MSKFPIFLNHIAESDQKHIRHCLKILNSSLHASETRLHSYQAEHAETDGNSVFKLITNLKETIAMAEAAIEELIRTHGLPADLGHIGDDYRRELREILTGRAPIDPA